MNNIKRKYANIDFKFLFLSSGFNLRNTEIGAYLGRFQLPKVNNSGLKLEIEIIDNLLKFAQNIKSTY